MNPEDWPTIGDVKQQAWIRAVNAVMMADPSHEPTMFHIGAQKWPGISKLMEECGEVLQVCGKLIATRGETKHWDGGPPLDERLLDELADLSAAINFVLSSNFTESQIEQWDLRVTEKIERFFRWHANEGRLIFERLHAEGGPISDVAPRTLSCGCSALKHEDKRSTENPLSADIELCSLGYPLER